METLSCSLLQESWFWKPKPYSLPATGIFHEFLQDALIAEALFDILKT